MLPTKQRIKLKRDFDRIFKLGRGLRGGLFVLKFMENQLPFCRGAVVVPAKLVPKAVLRNKIKRTVSEVLADVFPRCKTKVDILVIVQSDLKNEKVFKAKESLLEIFRKANIV